MALLAKRLCRNKPICSQVYVQGRRCLSRRCSIRVASNYKVSDCLGMYCELSNVFALLWNSLKTSLFSPKCVQLLWHVETRTRFVSLPCFFWFTPSFMTFFTIFCHMSIHHIQYLLIQIWKIKIISTFNKLYNVLLNYGEKNLHTFRGLTSNLG